jgi:type IV pilus assembly protein PilW
MYYRNTIMHKQPKRSASIGLTLVEIMIALVIGLLLVIGATSVYLQSRSTYKVSDSTARLQEIARYALDIIEPDIRLAGNWGLINTPSKINTTGPFAITNSCEANWVTNIDEYISARDGISTSGSGYNLACAGTNAPVAASTGTALWSDLLIVRHASATPKSLNSAIRKMQIQTSRADGALFSTGVLPAPYTAATSSTFDVVVNAYYISRVAGSPSSFPLWQLRRQELLAGTSGSDGLVSDQEVIPGIQDLQIQLGVDTSGDRAADQYVNPESVPVGSRVVSARIWLLAVSDEAESGYVNNQAFSYANVNHGAFNDNRRRLLMSKTIQIRNAQYLQP